MTQNQIRPTIAELSERIRKNAWNWDVIEFAKRLGRDPKSEYTRDQWRRFQALSAAFRDASNELLAIIATDAAGVDPVEDAALVLSKASAIDPLTVSALRRECEVAAEGTACPGPGPLPYNPDLPTCPRCKCVVPELLACGFCHDCA